jgi:predicted dehydrogenase
LFLLQGTRGQLEITEDRHLKVWAAGGSSFEDHGGDDWLRRELSEFAGGVATGAVGTATLRDGRAALACALAAARSAEEGGPVVVGV